MSKGSFYYRFPTRHTKSKARHHEHHNPYSEFFSICLVLAAKRSEILIADLPTLFQEYAGHVYADDIWDKRVPEAAAAAHAKVGLDAGHAGGGVVVVRPDGHVGCVVSLVKGTATVEALEEYFAAFFVGGTGVGRDRIRGTVS